MVKEGDSFKDIFAYLKFRIEHLRLEQQKVKFVIKDELRESVYKKFEAKINELEKTLQILNGNIKAASKFEYSKVQYLKNKKVEMIKKGNECEGKHPKYNECVICFAERNGEVCLDTNKKTFKVCKKHSD